MRPRRFQEVETFNRNGRVVAHILDTKSGRHHWIHRQGQTLLHWDLEDRLVENGLLRFAANNALDNYAEDLRIKLGSPCTRCGEPFYRPKGSRYRVCGNCKSEIGRKSAAKNFKATA